MKLLRKGVFPYDYMDEKWREKKLPPNKYFDSKLNNTKCSKEDYEYAQYICNDFKCDNEGCNNLYVETNVLLLADVF